MCDTTTTHFHDVQTSSINRSYNNWLYPTTGIFMEMVVSTSCGLKSSMVFLDRYCTIVGKFYPGTHCYSLTFRCHRFLPHY